MTRRYSAIGFDMDSTLMDTHVDYKGVVSEVGAVLREYGLDPSMWGRFEEVFESRGCPGDYARMSHEMIERCRHVEMRALPTAKPFPGSVECVDSLKRMGYRVGVLTSGTRPYAEACLGGCGLLERMDALVCSDDSYIDEAKPSPKAMDLFARRLGVPVEEILFIGDGDGDYLAAKHSGAGFIAVTSGRLKTDDWRAMDPDVTVMERASDILNQPFIKPTA